MPTFRATDPEGVVTEYDATTPNPTHLTPGWRLEELVTAMPSPDEPAPVPTVYGGRRELSRIEFLRLFTPQERITLREAAKTNAALADYLDLIDKAETVHLDHADVTSGLAMLTAGGLLAAGRAEEISNG